MPPAIDFVTFKSWRGPRIRGTMGFQMPKNPTMGDGCAKVVSALEGASYQSINMYDGQGLSLGLSQWSAKSGQLGTLLAGFKKSYPKVFENSPVPKALIKRAVEISDQGFVYLGGSKLIEGKNIVDKLCPNNGIVDSTTESITKEIALAFFELASTKEFRDYETKYLQNQMVKYLQYPLGLNDMKVCQGLGLDKHYVDFFMGSPLGGEDTQFKLVAFYLSMCYNAPAIIKSYLMETIFENKMTEIDIGKVFGILVQKCKDSNYGYWGNKKAEKAGRTSRTQKTLDVIGSL